MQFEFSFGKYSGVPLAEIPSGYLKWAFKSCDSLDEWDLDDIQTELRRRERGGWSSDKASQGYSRRDREGAAAASGLPVAVDAEIAVEIVKAGRRALALQFHPDKGGSSEKMVRANATADYLEKKLPSLLGARQ